MSRAAQNSKGWIAAGILLVLAVALALRYGTNILRKGPVFDEPYIVRPIDDLLARGWSMETALDYEETKGPAMIWTYAAAGELLGGALNDLRLVSVAFFVAGVLPLLWICRRAGLDGPQVLLVAALYVGLPYHAALSQLLMSEPSFVFWSLCLTAVFVLSFARPDRSRNAVLGPVAFGVLLAVGLHHRLHAVAFAPAVCLVAFERDRWRSWPWWVAGAAAGLSRLPLWSRWGGPVSPTMQGAHGLGLDLSAVTYMAAALVPWLAIALWPALTRPQLRHLRWLVWTGGVIGLALGVLARPDLTETLSYLDLEPRRFLGVVATTVRTVSPSPAIQALLLVALATVGAASLGAVAALAWQRPIDETAGVIGRTQVWVLAAGCALYALTHAAVYDRYVLPWAVLMPVLWVATLPRSALVLQGGGLAAMLGYMSWRLLVRI